MNKNIPLWRVVDSEGDWKTILTEMHDNSDHCEHEEIYWQIADCYWWKGLYKDVQGYVKTYEKCQHKAPFRKKEELHSIYVNTVWEKIEVDIIHLPPFKGCHYLVMAWDDLLGWLK